MLRREMEQLPANMQSTIRENQVLQTVIDEQKGQIHHLKHLVGYANGLLEEKSREIESLKQHEQNAAAMTQEIRELKKAKQLAVNILQKKQKAFESRKRQSNGMQSALSASKSQVAELKRENLALKKMLTEKTAALDSKVNENFDLQKQVETLNQKALAMNAEEERKNKEDQEKRKLLLEKLRIWKEYNLKQVKELKTEVVAARRVFNPKSLAVCQAQKDLQEELVTVKKELENVKKEFTTCKLELELQKKRFAEENLKQINDCKRKDEAIKRLKRQNGVMQNWITDPTNEVRRAHGELAAWLEAATNMQTVFSIEDDVGQYNGCDYDLQNMENVGKQVTEK